MKLFSFTLFTSLVLSILGLSISCKNKNATNKGEALPVSIDVLVLKPETFIYSLEISGKVFPQEFVELKRVIYCSNSTMMN
jgi:hypothetical protein